MANTKMGYEGILLYGVSGATAATQVTNCVDLNYDTGATRGDTTVRGSGNTPPIETSRVTALKAQITWKMLNKANDTTLAALRAAAEIGASVALRTKDFATGKGFDGDCTIDVKWGAPLKGEQVFEFTAEPNDDERTPDLYV